MPCPECAKHKLPGTVTSDGWNSNGPRRVIDTHRHYYIWTKRFKCKNHERPFTFLGYDPEVLELLPQVISSQLPCIITRRSAIDKKCFALLRRLTQTGHGMETSARLLGELSHFTYHQQHQLYLHNILAHNTIRSHHTLRRHEQERQQEQQQQPRQRSLHINLIEPQEFKEWDDRTGFSGFLVSAHYLTTLYLKEYYKKRVKWVQLKMQQIDGTWLRSDHSFKFVKKVYLDGDTLFATVLTVMNEYNQVHAL